MSRSFKVVWTHAAEKDLEAVIDFIAEEAPDTALKIFHKIKQRAFSLRHNPQRGRRIPELREYRDLSFRELILAPWRLMYRIVGQVVEVLAFLDSRRDLEELLYDRLI